MIALGRAPPDVPTFEYPLLVPRLVQIGFKTFPVY
jgi:hypothetical protein